MEIKEKKLVETMVVVGYICDKCKAEYNSEGKVVFHSGHNANYDVSEMTVHLCAKCFWGAYQKITSIYAPESYVSPYDNAGYDSPYTNEA